MTYTCNSLKIIQRLESGVLSFEEVANSCLAFISDDDLGEMANDYGWFDDEESED
jgi:hypothetical protein